jgi:DnaJ-domain-containing protein 1
VAKIDQVETPKSSTHTPDVPRARKDIPVARTRVDEPKPGPDRVCEVEGCMQAAEYPAPRNRDELRDYYWFCLEHVQAYNRAWDFFAGMSAAEVERFRIEAITGHRPTWKLGDRHFQAFMQGQVRDGFNFFGNGDTAGDAPGQAGANGPVDSKTRKALAELDLEGSVTLQEVKMRYKQLVKRYHPDANGGDKAAEERFKSINEAYSLLKSSGLA